MGGGLMTLLYGIVKREPVIIFGQGVATLIYIRNIMLIFKRARRGRSRLGLGASEFCADERRCSARRRQRGEAALEIGDQVVDVLEPDMEAHRRPARRPAWWRCARRRSRTE